MADHNARFAKPPEPRQRCSRRIIEALERA